ncbi:MAG: TetR/AcrR family transcriptional regulator [Oribacterium sp.]|nr:TetR/AcrR family transcriptional regulator [Oribacterium sp.]MBQ5330378.1 TetR/AcrR family transcriptional regulator [Oscillospiraceae bacterium]
MSDNESKAKLIECAKKEFLEKGFAKASLRKITSDAGLTTGAVYFFFRDKNGLFGAVVEEAIEGLKKLLTEHYADDMEEDFSEYVHVTGDHDELAKKLVDLIYDNYDVMMILFDKAHGSEYENVVDSVIALLESENLKTAEKYAKAFPGKRVNKYMLHYLSHVQVDAFEHLLSHESNRERALEHIKPVMDMFITTFMNYILEDDEV